MDRDRVVANSRAEGAKDNDAAVSRVDDRVALDDALRASHRDAVGPAAKGRVVPARANVIEADRSVAAVERALGNVQARPAAGVERPDVLDQLASDLAADLDQAAVVDRVERAALAVDLEVP